MDLPPSPPHNMQTPPVSADVVLTALLSVPQAQSNRILNLPSTITGRLIPAPLRHLAGRHTTIAIAAAWCCSASAQALPLPILAGSDAWWSAAQSVGNGRWIPGMGPFSSNWPLLSGSQLDCEMGALYDSNVFLRESNPSDDFGFWLRPSWVYQSNHERDTPASWSARYAPTWTRFSDHGELNAVDHTAQLELDLHAAHSRLTADCRYQESSATEPVTGQFSQASLLSLSLRGAYTFGAASEVHASWSGNQLRYDRDGQAGAESHVGTIGYLHGREQRWLWGPSIRASRSTGEASAEQSALALLASLRGSPRERVHLNADLGPQWVETRWLGHSDQECTTAATLSATLEVAARSEVSLSLQRIQIPSAEPTNRPLDATSLELTLQTTLKRGRLTAGVSCLHQQFEEPANSAVNNRSRELTPSAWVGGETELGQSGWLSRANIRYSRNDGREDWQRFECQIGFSHAF